MTVITTPPIIKLIFVIIAGTSFTRLVYHISDKWEGMDKTPHSIIRNSIAPGSENIIKPMFTTFILGFV